MVEQKYLYRNSYTEDFIKFASRDYENKEKLKIKCVENGIVLPLKIPETPVPLLGYGGVVDAAGNYVIESAQIGKGDTADRFIGKYEYKKSELEFFDEEVMYIGALPLHWGHFLIDMTYRFWAFFDRNIIYKKIVYCANNVYFNGVHLEFMKMLGVEEQQLVRIDKPTQFQKIYIPEPGYMACAYYTKEFRGVFTRLVDSLSKKEWIPYEKIYLSRGHFKSAIGKEIGENTLEQNFLNNGFKILYMEEMSLAEQAFYISNCKVMAALNGTLCHNALFANQNTTLIILNKTHIINTHQVLINQMIKCHVVYVDVYVEPFRHFPLSYGDGPFLLDGGMLPQFFADNSMKWIEQKTLRKWYNYLLYLKMCFITVVRIEYAKGYQTAYKRVCRYKWLIQPLRMIRKAMCTLAQRRVTR